VNISILFVRLLLTELRQRDITDAAALADSRIDAAMLANLRATVTNDEWVKLLLRALDLTGDPALGIALGETFSPSMLQVVGQLLASCRTLREAIAAFMHYQELLSSNTRNWELQELGDSAYLYCGDNSKHPVAKRVSLEGKVGLAYQVGRALIAQGANEVWFEHEAPPYAQQYARVFACPVRFSQPRNALVFARQLLDTPQPHADETLNRVLSVSAETLLRGRAARSITERVRALLRYEQDVARMTPEYVAGQLNMKVRSLRRRLGAEHSSLTDLLDEARLRVAERALVKPGASIKEVAHELGFSEASAFHRAFKRWSGRTPAQFMKEPPSEAAS
jgi:AraC-like DNA-binding protein